MRKELLALAAPRLRRIPPVVARLLLAAFALTVALALLVARQGTYRARFGAWAMLACFGLVYAIVRYEEKKLRSTPHRLIARLFGKHDPIAGRIEQALTVLEANDPGVSSALAELHFTRTLAAVDRKQLDRVALRRATQLGAAFWLVTGLAAVCVVWRFFALVEGANVLAARDEVAPLELDYVANLDLRIRPPDYLRAEERQGRISTAESAPKGSLLTLRGAPVQPGRAVFLSDGTSEVPFVDDGTGQIVARFPLSQDADLRVLARFGDVKIFDPVHISVHAILDRAPEVMLDGAPRTVRLAAEDITEIPIRYDAEDDHGLREVHLVLRSGTREERRTLAKLDGTTRRDRGGYVLRLKDAFIARSYAPVEVVVEAKDNDPIDGPKWGRSAAITLVPPEVGEPEALRIAALRELRDQLVDTLASSLVPLAKDAAAKGRQARELGDKIGENDGRLTTLLLSRFASLRIPSRLAVLLQGQNGKVKQASKAYLAAPSAATRASTATALERFVLVVDAVGQGRAVRDARQVARKLSEIADELTTAERMLESAGPETPPTTPRKEPSVPAEDTRSKALARAGAAKSLLGGGGRWLSELGVLGRDLGEIVVAYDKRVVRSENGDDYFHAALAAADLAARLSEPDPSFQSQGGAGGGGFGGGEAGGSSGTPSEQGGEASEVEKAFQEAAAELGSLVEQHAEKLAETERDSEGKADPEDVKEFQDEMKKHAEAIRKAAQALPSVGGGSGSWTGKAAEAREQAEQMAKALESGSVADAVQNGRAAKDAVTEAKQRGRAESDSSAQPKLDEAGKRLDEEIAFAEKTLKALKKKAQSRGAGELGKRGEDEGDLAERMRGLGEKAGEHESLPDGALDALRAAERSAKQAAEALRRGDGERGLAEQREAQHALERAKEALGRDDDDRDGEGDGEGEGDAKLPDGRADIPKADAHKGPDAFRQRVMKGLGQAQGKNRDAVQRYAEGLVR